MYKKTKIYPKIYSKNTPIILQHLNMCHSTSCKRDITTMCFLNIKHSVFLALKSIFIITMLTDCMNLFPM